MPLHMLFNSLRADRSASALSVLSKNTLQKIAIRHSYNLKPHNVIVVLLYIRNLDKSDGFSLVHDGQATRPAKITHTKLGYFFRSAHRCAGMI